MGILEAANAIFLPKSRIGEWKQADAAIWKVNGMGGVVSGGLSGDPFRGRAPLPD
jgi:hypothetical protein